MNLLNSTKVRKHTKTQKEIAMDILKLAEQMGHGKPFSACELLHLGERTQIDRALSKLVHARKLVRVMQGMYVLPKISGPLGQIPPSVKDILQAVSRVTGEIFEVSPQRALSALRLTTQNQVGKVFSTTGRSRTLKLNGMQPIYLKSVPWKKAVVPLMGSMAGVAAIGLLFLGKENVDEDVMKTVRKNIPTEDFDRLLFAAPEMPSWLADILFTVNVDLDHPGF